MKVTKKDCIIIIVLLMIVVPGMWHSFTYTLVEEKKAFRLSVRWFLIPSILFALYVGYYSTYIRGPEQAMWRKYLGVLALSFITAMILLRSFEGFVLMVNRLGNQSEILLSGVVTGVDRPKKKKALSTYTLEIKLADNSTVYLDTYHTTADSGFLFRVKLQKGSFGILYKD